MPILEFNIIDIIGVTYAFSATQAECTPPQRGERGGHVCVEKRRHLCYKYAKTATLPQMRDASSLPALCQRRGSLPPHTPIARTASIV